MKSLTLFLQEVLLDLEDWCCTSTSQDLKTILARIEHEGLSFLTITLPAFGKDFQKSLDLGAVDPSAFAGFSRRQGLPRFLGGFLDQVFDRRSGRLLQEPSVTAIWAIRQVTLMFGKMESYQGQPLECTPARQRAAIRQYLECEQDVRDSDAALDPVKLDQYRRIGRLLWADLFCRLDREIFDGEVIIPKHGPGSTAERLLGNEKYDQREWTDRLEAIFPYGEYCLPNWRHHDRLTDVQFLEPGKERPVRVVLVPKTLRTPRIIAIEPTCMQYMQQALLARFNDAFEKDDISRASVSSSSQVPNQHCAWEGSRNGTLATLDLSEASDRVSNQHVRELLRNHRYLFEAVDSTRSRKADVPGHGVIRLAKFASMGSALTFPMESIVFLTIVYAGIESSLGRPLTKKDVFNLLGKVRVYGDDTIVPVEHVRSVVTYLEAFGLKVNVNKSFWTGKFRESCGKEYYDGHDVTISRVTHDIPTNRQHSSEIISSVALRNRCYKAGLWRAARHLDLVLGRLIPMPMVAETSPVQGRHSFLGYDSTQRMSKHLHSPLVKGLLVQPVIPRSNLDDLGALMKVLLRAASKRENPSPLELVADLVSPDQDTQHLMRAGRPKRVNTKLGWGSPF